MNDMLPDEKKEKPAARHSLHRELPKNLDAERGLLCSLLLNPALLDEFATTPADLFSLPAHARIFEVIRDLHSHGKPVDMVTVTEALTARGLLEECGGPMLITELADFVPSAAHWDHYLALLRTKHKLRGVIRECERLIAKAYEASTDDEEVETVLEETESTLFRLRDEGRLDADILDSRAVMNAVVDSVEIAHKHRGRTIGIPTGFYDIDRMMGGFMNEELYIIAARPSQGKSAIMMNMFRHQVLGDDKFSPVPVGLFSLEMPAVDQGKRLVADDQSIPLQKFRDGFFGEQDMRSIATAAGRFHDARYYIDSTPALSIQQFRAKARRMVSKWGVRIIYIDYLQLMRSTSKRAQDNRQAEVAEISQLLKRTARELRIPVVALAQLTRDAENKKPSLAHLRESGQLEQDADGVIFVYRPEKGATDNDGRTLEVENAYAIVAKQRNGPVGEVNLRFVGKYTRFENVTEAQYSNNQDKRQKR